MLKIRDYIYDAIYSFIDFNTKFRITRMNNLAKIPKKADPGCAGYDVFSTVTVDIQPWTRQLVNLGIKAEISENYYLRIAPRSGYSVRGIDIGAGVVDSSYRGEIKVLVINNSDSVFHVETGCKIAQLILERCSNAEVEDCDVLSETERGNGGFGSSGN